MRLNKRIGRCVVLAMLMFGFPGMAHANTYFYCVVQNFSGSETRYVSDIRETSAADIDEMQTGFAYSDEIAEQWKRDYPGESNRKSYCSSSQDPERLIAERAIVLEDSPAARQLAFSGSPVVIARPLGPAEPNQEREPAEPVEPEVANQTEAPARPAEPDEHAGDDQSRLAVERERREAEWQAELAKYESDKRAWEAEVARIAEEERRKQAALAEARARAAEELARFEQEQARFQRELEERVRQQRLYEAELERNRLCREGVRRACREINAGKPALDEAPAQP